MWWQNFLDVFGYKIDIFHISCAIALISYMVVFTPKLLVIYCENCDYKFFNIILCYYFSLETDLRGLA